MWLEYTSKLRQIIKVISWSFEVATPIFALHLRCIYLFHSLCICSRARERIEATQARSVRKRVELPRFSVSQALASQVFPPLYPLLWSVRRELLNDEKHDVHEQSAFRPQSALQNFGGRFGGTGRRVRALKALLPVAYWKEAPQPPYKVAEE